MGIIIGSSQLWLLVLIKKFVFNLNGYHKIMLNWKKIDALRYTVKQNEERHASFNNVISSSEARWLMSFLLIFL